MSYVKCSLCGRLHPNTSRIVGILNGKEAVVCSKICRIDSIKFFVYENYFGLNHNNIPHQAKAQIRSHRESDKHMNQTRALLRERELSRTLLRYV